MNQKTKRALLSAAGAVVSAAAIREGISKAIDRNMVGEALDREAPKAMKKILGKLKGYELSSEDLDALHDRVKQMESLPHETVTMESYDGTQLTGHLFRAEHPKRAIVAMHGWRSGWSKDFALVSEFLHQNDCTVLYAEQRGQGESGGEYMGFGMIERFDCLEWAKWMNANGCAELPLYLVGISMGATTVLMTAGFENLPANTAGIIADCGFTSAKAVWKHISEDNLRLSYARREKHVDKLVRNRIDLESDAYSTLDAMQNCRVPVLLIHGDADTFVPMQMSQENYDACIAPKELLIVEGANHAMSYVTDRERYEAAVLKFWAEQENRTVENEPTV